MSFTDEETEMTGHGHTAQLVGGRAGTKPRQSDTHNILYADRINESSPPSDEAWPSGLPTQLSIKVINFSYKWQKKNYIF